MTYKPVAQIRFDIYTDEGVYKGYLYKMFDRGWYIDVPLLTKEQMLEVHRKQTELNAEVGIILTAE